MREVPVPSFVTVTLTPGTTAPLSSETSPRIVPNDVWALAEREKNNAAANATHRVRNIEFLRRVRVEKIRP